MCRLRVILPAMANLTEQLIRIILCLIYSGQNLPHIINYWIEYYEFLEENIKFAAETAHGNAPKVLLERVPSWLCAREPGETPGRMPALWGLLPAGLAVPLLLSR